MSGHIAPPDFPEINLWAGVGLHCSPGGGSGGLLLRSAGERHDSEVQFLIKGAQRYTGGGGRRDQWRICPKLGQRLSRGTKGQGAQVGHHCTLLKATGRVREEPQDSLFSSGSRNPPLRMGNALCFRVDVT